MQEDTQQLHIPDTEKQSFPEAPQILHKHRISRIMQRYENELSRVKDWMFWFLMLWTMVILLMEWSEFLLNWIVPHAMQAGYIVLLGGYIAHKEVLRWMDVPNKERRGEIFVYIWWGTLLIMFVTSYLWVRWDVPDSITTICYEVLGYLVFTEVSKAINMRREGQRKQP